MEFRLSLPAAHDVVGHGDIAVRAFDDITAASAADEAVVPAAIHQQHGLFAARDAVLECRDQLPGNTLRLPFSISLRMSTSVTCGIGRLPTREGISSST